MGNGVLFLFCFGAARPGRAEAAELTGLFIDGSQIDVGVAHDPVAGMGFGYADGLAGEDFADEDEFSAPFDLAAGPHASFGVIGVVPGLRQIARPGPGAWAVERGGRLLIERLMGAIVVEVMPEVVEARLLLGQTGGMTSTTIDRIHG